MTNINYDYKIVAHKTYLYFIMILKQPLDQY